MTVIVDTLYYIGLILSLVAIVMSFVLLITIKADKPIQQDDHDYSDLTKILGGTCNWDEDEK
jgi:hypothetical protein